MSFWKPGSKQRDEVQQKNMLNDEALPAPDNRSSMQKNVPEKDVKTSLSKGVMTMKFMKRKADADLEAITTAEKRRRALDSSWTSDAKIADTRTAEDKLVCTIVDNDLASGLPGRRSFGGFNKAVERNYEQMIDEKRFNKASEKASKNSVSDAEMLVRYESLIGLPRGQSQGMRPKKEKVQHVKGTSGQADRADRKI